MTQTDDANQLPRLTTHEVNGPEGGIMPVLFDSTYQRLPGFRRVKSKASGRSLAHPDTNTQLSLHLHLRTDGQPKEILDGTSGEVLYALYVSWLNERAFLDLRRVSDGAWVAHAIGVNEGEAFQQIEKQIAALGL